MKVISIWQPWASLIVHGFKTIETRGFAVPKSVVGQRIGIAATRVIKPEQRAALRDRDFAQFYFETNLPRAIEDLPLGCILGTAVVHSCEPVTQELADDLSTEELAFGWYQEGRYAWRLRHVERFETPIVARGAQGLWTWDEHGVLADTVPTVKREGVFATAICESI